MNSPKVLLIKDVKADNTLDKVLLDNAFTILDSVEKTIDFHALTASQKPDIVVFDINYPTPETLALIRIINNEHACPVIIFAQDSDQDSINKVIKAGVSAYVVDGLRSNRIKAIIDIAIARFKEQQALKTELKKTKDKLEERKALDRAKGILIKARNISEDEAYHTLRKLAMERNIAIGEMAKNVISMEQLLN